MHVELGTVMALASLVFTAGTAWGVVWRLPREVQRLEVRFDQAMREMQETIHRLPSPDAMAAVKDTLKRHEEAISTLQRHEADIREELAEIRSGAASKR